MSTAWVVYSRVSTEEQADSGASLNMQRDQCRAMAVALGHQQVEVLADDGYTGKDLKRPAMQLLLAQVRAGEIAGVIIWKLDRLTRRVKDLLQLVELFGERNVALVSLHEKIDTSGPMGRFVLIIMGAVAQLEQETIAHRVKSSMNYLRSQGFWAGGRPPMGTRIIGPAGKRLLEVVPEQAAVVAEIFAGCVAGVGLNDLALRLQQSGVVKQRPTATNMAMMLRRRRFVELGMISAELFAAAGAAIESRRPGTLGKPAGRPATTRIWPLTGLARCGRCGAPMVGAYAHGRSGVRYAYLRCTGRARKRCNLPDLPADPWEEKAVQGIKRAIATEDWRKAWAAWCDALQRDAAPAEEEHQRLTIERDKVEAKVRRLLDLVADGDAPGTVTKATLARLEAQVAECDRQLHAVVGRKAAGELLDQRRRFIEVQLLKASKALESASREKVGEILRSAVASITLEVEPASMVIEMFEPGPEGGPGSYNKSRMVQQSGMILEPGPRVRYALASVRRGQSFGLEWAENSVIDGRSVLAAVPTAEAARRLGVSRRVVQRWKAGEGTEERLRGVASELLLGQLGGLDQSSD